MVTTREIIAWVKSICRKHDIHMEPVKVFEHDNSYYLIFEKKDCSTGTVLRADIRLPLQELYKLNEESLLRILEDKFRSQTLKKRKAY